MIGRNCWYSSRLGALLLAAAGCQGPPRLVDPAGDPDVNRATRLVAISPTAFHARPGSPVTPPAIRVLDAAGKPVADVVVHFTVVSGGGQVAPTAAVTGPLGEVAAGWVLGGSQGENLLVARVDGLAPVAFLATSGFEPVAEVFGLARINDDRIPDAGPLGGSYHLYGDGTFARRQVLGGLGAPITVRLDVGAYTTAGPAFTFSAAGTTWSGVARGDSLVVVHANHRDTEVYARTPPAPPPPVESLLEQVYERVTLHQVPAGARSRFVLRADSTFSLEYALAEGAEFEYPGRYRQTGTVIDFDFDAWSATGEWRASGTLRGDSLHVAFNAFMSLSDFEDGSYLRVAGQQAPRAAAARHRERP